MIDPTALRVQIVDILARCASGLDGAPTDPMGLIDGLLAAALREAQREQRQSERAVCADIAKRTVQADTGSEVAAQNVADAILGQGPGRRLRR